MVLLVLVVTGTVVVVLFHTARDVSNRNRPITWSNFSPDDAKKTYVVVVTGLLDEVDEVDIDEVVGTIDDEFGALNKTNDR